MSGFNVLAQSDAAMTRAAFTADDFKAVFRQHPGGVALITAVGSGGPVAMTATSVASVSAEPPILVFSVSELSSSAPTLREAESAVVHLLDAETLHLAQLGATSGIDRFADETLWTRLVTGEPVFHGTRWLRAEIMDRITAGTATLVVARAVESNVSAAEAGPAAGHDGLAYVNRAWHRLDEASRIA